MKASAACLMILLFWALVDDARGQLFGGTRRQGSPMNRRAGAGDNAEVGAVRGNERFIRGNRRRNDFIGTDTRDTAGFVGLQQGSSTGQVRSATAGLDIEREQEANTTRRPDTIYDPRLVVGFDVTRPSDSATAARLAKRLAATPGLTLREPVRVTFQGQTATLSGQVASSRDRELAALVLLLEPGVATVRNNLSVAPPDSRQPMPRPLRLERR
ncbi:MAG: BON domain-containing protein [Pirellulales bacterium]|nr:BON domain-containing protein [Pirellulales bacterium]